MIDLYIGSKVFTTMIHKSYKGKVLSIELLYGIGSVNKIFNVEVKIKDKYINVYVNENNIFSTKYEAKKALSKRGL